MLSASSLGALLEADGGPRRLLRHLFERTRYLFIYGFRPTAADSATARHLSRGLVDSVVRLSDGNQQYTISADWTTTALAGPARRALDSGHPRDAPAGLIADPGREA
jgi:hypothetical protein